MLLKLPHEDDVWYKLESKKGNGWAPGWMLKIYDLAPGGAPVDKSFDTTPEIEKKDREEFTYFEASIPDAPVFKKPDPKAKKIGVSPKTAQEWVGSKGRFPNSPKIIKKIANEFDVGVHVD